MTTETETTRRSECLHCGTPLETAVRPGRPRRYCGTGCRQLAYLARLRERANNCPIDELVVRTVTEVGEGMTVTRVYSPLDPDDDDPGWEMTATVDGKSYSARADDLVACVEMLADELSRRGVLS